MTMIPPKSANPDGLYQRYNISKVDGESVDPMATYFVLRLDQFGRDGIHTAACRAAARTYAGYVQSSFCESDHLKRVGEQLQTLVDNIEAAAGIRPDPSGDKKDGFLHVGINERAEVVLNLDYDRTGHIVFSANQARQLAALLIKKADEVTA